MVNFFLAGEFSEFEGVIKEKFKEEILFEKGQIIIALNDIRNYCYYIIKGTVFFRMVHKSGKCKISTFRGKGTIFPLYYSYEETVMEHELEVISISDVKVIKMKKKDLKNLLIQNLAISLKMCDAYCKYTTYLLYDMENYLFENYVYRICNFIYGYSLSLKNSSDRQFINLTHEEIGMAIGASRANVSRVISQLKKEKIIETKRNSIKIIDEKRLLEFVDKENF